MKTHRLANGGQEADAAWTQQHLGDHNFRERRRLLDWWYHLTTPRDPGVEASFQTRDLARRGRVASTILLCLLLIMPLVGLIGLLGPNKQILITALVVELFLLVSCWLNRAGKVNQVGIALSLTVTLGMYVSLLRAPGGLSVDDKDIFYLLVFSELIIGAILPASWIVVGVAVNLLFAALMLTFGPHTAALDAYLANSSWTVFLRLLQLHLIPASIVWSLALLGREQTRRADRAETVARLEHTIAQLKDEQGRRARQLDAHIQLIILTLNQVGQGELSARVKPLDQQATLWALVGSMNTLLSRYQRAKQNEQQAEARDVLYRHHHEEIALIQSELQRALHEERPFRLPAQVKVLLPLFKHFEGVTLHRPSVSHTPSSHK